MQRLILLRHGKADSVSTLGGDLERGLTDRGRRDAALMGRVLAEGGFAPDLALVSSARRARETWEEAAPAFPKAAVEFSRSLYLASRDHLMHTIDASGEAAGCLIIVGHNPGAPRTGPGLRLAATDRRQRHAGFLPDSGGGGVCANAAGRVVAGADDDPTRTRRRGAVSLIYKLLDHAAWDEARAAGVFQGSAVDLKDGFIHFSSAAQVAETARRYFAGQAGVILLAVDAKALGGALRWEPSRGGDLFPHLYAPLPASAVISARQLELDADGVPLIGELAA